MRAGVYDRFWHSQGGGERHCAMVGVVLARSGVEVDLLTHQELDKAALAEHLGLDLSGVGVRLVPDKGDHEVAVVSADHDLFVNGSCMSRLAPRARRNAYLCCFPTPFDADLTPRRRQWIWTSGDAVLAVPPGKDRTLRFELGGPGLPEPVTLAITDEHGDVLGEHPVTPEFRVHRLVFPDAVRGTELHFSSPTFVPARAGGVDSDRRTLGVAVSRCRSGPTSPRWRRRPPACRSRCSRTPRARWWTTCCPPRRCSGRPPATARTSRTNPWASEHFGMTTVEAMAGGCVPVVIDRAGQREIVREGLDGYRWSTPEELVERTGRVARDEALRARLAAAARERAHRFDEDAFAERWCEIAARHDLR